MNLHSIAAWHKYLEVCHPFAASLYFHLGQKAHVYEWWEVGRKYTMRNRVPLVFYIGPIKIICRATNSIGHTASVFRYNSSVRPSFLWKTNFIFCKGPTHLFWAILASKGGFEKFLLGGEKRFAKFCHNDADNVAVLYNVAKNFKWNCRFSKHNRILIVYFVLEWGYCNKNLRKSYSGKRYSNSNSGICFYNNKSIYLFKLRIFTEYSQVIHK